MPLVHLSQDSRLQPLIERINLPAPDLTGDLYFGLLSSIVSQQLSTKVADVIFARFLNLFEGQYPHPHQLLRLEHDVLRSVGLSNSKANYLKNVAEFFIQENLENKNWDDLDDEAIIKYLSQIKGVGKWTVEMILMFTLHRPDVFPVDDLGIQQAMMRLYDLPNDKTLKPRMHEIAEAWRPHRTTACRYLWRWKDGKIA